MDQLTPIHLRLVVSLIMILILFKGRILPKPPRFGGRCPPTHPIPVHGPEETTRPPENPDKPRDWFLHRFGHS